VAPPSLKKMEGQIKEGIYASSNNLCKGKIIRNDLGLTLFPGSQTQTEDEGDGHPGPEKTQQGRDFLKELSNGSKKGLLPSIGRYTLHGNVNQEVLLRARAPDHARTGLDKSTRPRLGETTHVPDSEAVATAVLRSTVCSSTVVPSAVLASATSPSKRKSSKSCTVTAVVSEVPLFAACEDNGCKAVELAPSPFQTVEGEDVGFSGGARQGESDAEDNLDVLRPHKRQKIDEYIPSEQFGGFQDTCIDRSSVVVKATKQTWNGDVAVVSPGQKGVMRSRSHGPTNDVARIRISTSFENLYREPRSTSLPAPEVQPRRLSISNSLRIALDHSMVLSSNTESFHTQYPTGQPASSKIQTSTAFGTPVQPTRSPGMSRRSLQMPRSTASELRTVNLSDTSSPEDYFHSYSPFDSAQRDVAIPEGGFESAIATSSLDNHGAERFSEFWNPPVSSALPAHQGNLSEAFSTASSNTLRLAQTQFTTSPSWQAHNSTDQTISSSSTSDGATTQKSSRSLNDSLQHRINPLENQDDYQSPYAPQPHRPNDQVSPQIKMTDTTAIHGLHARDRLRTSTTGFATIVSQPSAYSTSQSPNASSMNTSTRLPSRSVSQGMQSGQQSSNSPMPLPSPHQQAVSKTGARVIANAELSSSGCEETSSEATTEELSSQRKEILLPPELVGPAKRAIDAVCPFLLERMHHADIVPRVLSFIKTFPLPDDAPFTAGDVSPANLMDLHHKNQSLIERNADLTKERDKYRRAAGDWTKVDPATGQTKGQTMSRELRRLRSELSKRTEEVEEFRKAWAEFDAARAASALIIDTSAVYAGAPLSRTSNSLHARRVGATMKSIQVPSRSGSMVPSAAAGPTPPASQRVSIDLTEGTPPPSSTSSAPPPSIPPPPASSPEAAALRTTMKRKTYSWLPSESNHMVKKPKPAARGSQPSTPINIEVASPVIDADAELEAELERELLASQQVDERAKQKAATYERQKAAQKEKRDVMKLARETAKQKQREKAREERAVEERRETEVEKEQRMAAEEQRRKEAEDTALDEELFGTEEVVEGEEDEEDEEDDDIVDQQGGADVFMGYMPEQHGAETTTLRLVEESSEESEEE